MSPGPAHLVTPSMPLAPLRAQRAPAVAGSFLDPKRSPAAPLDDNAVVFWYQFNLSAVFSKASFEWVCGLIGTIWCQARPTRGNGTVID
jgi:hypothetical protein